MLLCFMGCSDDEGISYPTSDAPEIKVLRDELYSNPNRKFVIKADLKDDLGLKSLKIVIPEFYLDKEIVFPTDTLVTEYELAYEFLAPKDTKNEDVYKVNLALEDVSGNVVTKELTLHLDGDFNAPNFSNVSPQDGTVQLLESKMGIVNFPLKSLMIRLRFSICGRTDIGYHGKNQIKRRERVLFQQNLFFTIQTGRV